MAPKQTPKRNPQQTSRAPAGNATQTAPKQTSKRNPQQTSRTSAGNATQTPPQPASSHGRGQAQQESNRNYLADALSSMLLVGLVHEKRVKEILQQDPKAQLQSIAVLKRILDDNLPVYVDVDDLFCVRGINSAQACLTRFEEIQKRDRAQQERDRVQQQAQQERDRAQQERDRAQQERDRAQKELDRAQQERDRAQERQASLKEQRDEFQQRLEEYQQRQSPAQQQRGSECRLQKEQLRALLQQAETNMTVLDTVPRSGQAQKEHDQTRATLQRAKAQSEDVQTPDQALALAVEIRAVLSRITQQATMASIGIDAQRAAAARTQQDRERAETAVGQGTASRPQERRPAGGAGGANKSKGCCRIS